MIYQCVFYLIGDSTVHPCPVGRYCPLGNVTQKCPENTYRDIVGGKNLSDCFQCPAGFWCNLEGLPSYNNTECPIGRYCLKGHEPIWCPAGRLRMKTGGKTADDCDPCYSGYYCPSGNVSAIPCSAGTYCPNNGSDGAPAEKMCPGGYYCTAITGDPIICPGISYIFDYLNLF